MTVSNRKLGHECLFCGKKKAKIGRHILSHHRNNKHVDYLYHLPKLSEERKVLLDILLHDGDLKRNMKILKAGKGAIIVTHSSPNLMETSPSDYFCCIYCRKVLLKKSSESHSHLRHCKAKKYMFAETPKNTHKFGDDKISISEDPIGAFVWHEKGE